MRKSTIAPSPDMIASFRLPVSFHLSKAAVIPLKRDMKIVAITNTLPSIFKIAAGLNNEASDPNKPSLKKFIMLSKNPPPSPP